MGALAASMVALTTDLPRLLKQPQISNTQMHIIDMISVHFKEDAEGLYLYADKQGCCPTHPVLFFKIRIPIIGGGLLYHISIIK